MEPERRKSDYDMKERMVAIETKFDNHAKQMADAVAEIQSTNRKLDQIREVLAENRGAAKAARFVWGVIISILGFFGGMIGAFIRHVP